MKWIHSAGREVNSFLHSENTRMLDRQMPSATQPIIGRMVVFSLCIHVKNINYQKYWKSIGILSETPKRMQYSIYIRAVTISPMHWSDTTYSWTNIIYIWDRMGSNRFFALQKTLDYIDQSKTKKTQSLSSKSTSLLKPPTLSQQITKPIYSLQFMNNKCEMDTSLCISSIHFVWNIKYSTIFFTKPKQKNCFNSHSHRKMRRKVSE